VVAKQPNSGTFIATFVNGSPDKTISLESVSGDNTAISNVDATPFSLEPGTLRNLATEGGIPVSGTFTPGQFVNLSISFDDGETADMSVPVVDDEGRGAGLAPPTPPGSPDESPGESPTASP